MPSRKLSEILKHIDFMSLGVPIGVVIISSVFPLRPLVQQALVGIMLIWFGTELMAGCPFWK